MKTISSNNPDPERLIREIRGQRVILAHDLAALYEVPTKALNQAVARNLDRFPEDFMFPLTGAEIDALLSTTEPARRAPLVHSSRIRAFTEHGVAMLSSVLQSPRAVQVNIHIIRAFIRMRRASLTHEAVLRRIDSLEQKTDRRFHRVFEAIKTLLAPPEDARPRIGFSAD